MHHLLKNYSHLLSTWWRRKRKKRKSQKRRSRNRISGVGLLSVPESKDINKALLPLTSTSSLTHYYLVILVAGYIGLLHAFDSSHHNQDNELRKYSLPEFSMPFYAYT
jgi:hypothetical protein